ncbi:MAG TPA: ABC transporter [Lachnospiraceae bacterium]|nr:ABC transporter [Lachnospiraceae bacterium]HCR41112.1 ABC transporter [Lachnospiraceae bacterium]
MLKLMKYLKGSVFAILTVFLLLVVQAICDLSLPAYTSDIVNVGIMQNGIDRAVPDVIRKSELDTLTLLMEESDKDLVFRHYTLLEQKNVSDKEWSDYVKNYPLLDTEPLYRWDNKEEKPLEDAFAIPMMVAYIGNSSGESADLMKKQLFANFPSMNASGEVDFKTLLPMLPEETRQEMLQTIKKVIEQIPEQMVSQTATAYVKAEYKAIGINLAKIQNRYILLVGVKMLALALGIMLISILVTLLASRVAGKLGKDLRNKVFQKVLSFSNKEMDQFSTASLITRSTNDIQQVQSMFVMMIRIVLYSPILAIGGIFKVLQTNNSMTWILAAGVAVIFALILVLMIIALPKFKLMQKLVDRINLVTREIITGLPVIRAFSTEEHEKKRFDKANIDLTKNSLFVNRVMTFLMPALMLIMNLISILIIWVGADKINSGSMQVGDMIAFIQYTMQIIMSFLMLTMISILLPRASVSAKRIDEIISAKNTINDPAVELSLQTNKGIVEFDHVSFRYPNAEEDVLSDIHFTARPGQTTAIIGSTGSGKSTLINLLPRFYDVTQGTIRIDGVDIKQMKQHELRDRLGLIPQKGVLFTGTIESNIKFGNPDASDEEMKRAARIAQASEFIDKMPDGYQTPIAQGGMNVSGGQKQRLAIARTIAKDPEIYIFDDSFSALDYKTDATLRKTLKQELSNRTMIIVAQRISTIMNAEQILVLDEGRIIGKGTHKELLKTCETYRQIASSQLSKEELDYEE